MVAGEGKQEILQITSNQNPIKQIHAKFKQVEVQFNSWLSKQSLPVEAAIVTTGGVAKGGLIGAIIGTLQDMSSNLPLPPQNTLDPKAMASFQQARPMIQARNFAVLAGVEVGISAVLKRLKGKEDVRSIMIAAFGPGAMLSLVSGMSGPNQVQNMVSFGLFFALAQGGIYKLGELSRKPPVDDP